MKPTTYHAIIGEHLYKNIKLSEFTQKLSYLDNKLQGVNKLIQTHKLIELDSQAEVPSVTEIDGKNGDLYLIKKSSDSKFELVLGKDNLIREIRRQFHTGSDCEYINYTQDINDIEDVTSPTQLERIQTLAEILSSMDEEGLTNDENSEVTNIINSGTALRSDENSFEAFFNKGEEEKNQEEKIEEFIPLEDESKEDEEQTQDEAETITFEDDNKDNIEDDENPIFKLERQVLSQSQN